MPHLTAFFRAIGGLPDEFLDIACGTGVLTNILSANGVRVTGIDISPQMIRAAKSKQYLTKPKFHVGDMRTFDLGQTFPVTGCFYDALNHLSSEKDLLAAFSRAASHTEKGGYYVFDVLTPTGLKHWKPYWAQKSGHYLVCQRGHFDSANKTRVVHIEAFVKTGLRSEHVEEVLTETAFEIDVVKRLLARAGFRKLVLKPFVRYKTLASAGRLVFICRK
jgi:SAM-dependent methyltransferase